MPFGEYSVYQRLLNSREYGSISQKEIGIIAENYTGLFIEENKEKWRKSSNLFLKIPTPT